MISIERESMIRSRKMFANEYRLREWIGEFIDTTAEYRAEIERLKAENQKLEQDVMGWRAVADRAIAQGEAVGVGEKVYPSQKESDMKCWIHGTDACDCERPEAERGRRRDGRR